MVFAGEIGFRGGWLLVQASIRKSEGGDDTRERGSAPASGEGMWVRPAPWDRERGRLVMVVLVAGGEAKGGCWGFFFNYVFNFFFPIFFNQLHVDTCAKKKIRNVYLIYRLQVIWVQ